MIVEAADSHQTKGVRTGAKERKLADKVKGLVLDRKLKMEKYNDAIYKEIEALRKQLSPNADTAFDNFATGFGLLCEEYLKARNTTELLTICKIYNQGQLDDVFAAIKQENHEKNDDDATYDRSSSANAMQEEQPTASTEPTSTDTTTTDTGTQPTESRHEQDRDLQDGVRLEAVRDERLDNIGPEI